MSLKNRRAWMVLAPLAAGAAVLLSLKGLNSFQAGSRPAKAPSEASSENPAPPNPAHERAALEEQLKKNPDHAPILFRLAEMERDAGRPAGAVPFLEKILEHDPSNLDARLELGRALYDSGNTDRALKETQRLLADHPGQVDGLYNLGAIYANLNRADLARQHWSQAVAADPKSDSGKRAKEAMAQLGR